MGNRLKGIVYPFQRGAGGLFKTAENAEAVKSRLFMLLDTNTRTRVMRPQLGLNIIQVIFDNKGPMLQAKLRRILADGIGRFEPDVRLLSINVAESGTKIIIDITYRIQSEVDTLQVEVDRENGTITRNN